MRILGISGSLQAGSGNRALLELAARVAEPGVEVARFDGLRDLPFFDPDLEAAGVPPAVAAWRRAVGEHDALLIACPEYGHSLPGVLKNAIDWMIGSTELNRKVVGVTASVTSPVRGRLGLQALLQTLGAVDAIVVGGEPIARGPDLEREVAALVRAVAERVRAGLPEV